MSTEIANPKSTLPATADWAGAGLEDVTHADTTQKYISLNKDSGVITLAGTDVILGDSKKPFKMTPVFHFLQWNYVRPDGMAVFGKELIHQKNHNITLRDEETVAWEVDGKKEPAIRRQCRTIVCLVADNEGQGPMILSAMRSKKRAMEASLMGYLNENKTKNLPIFAQEFYVSSEQRTNKKNQKFYVYTFKPADMITDPTKLQNLFSLYKSLAASQERLVSATSDADEGAAF